MLKYLPKFAKHTTLLPTGGSNLFGLIGMVSVVGFLLGINLDDLKTDYILPIKISNKKIV